MTPDRPRNNTIFHGYRHNSIHIIPHTPALGNIPSRIPAPRAFGFYFTDLPGYGMIETVNFEVA